ncbi:hypothetical protein JAAARDRAFT_198518 [Jaapia argillacea MUCL 33604]|uniref:Uncharacterized protein n=1 Tax=Jaapia argillacea MUCL 33604 TaxID=933084 RepID=A0A067PAZ1_9AGAM|nr:hypothetical protein JAAARDRAFT_198518 [Jaapia argillacea MUCL 33604]
MDLTTPPRQFQDLAPSTPDTALGDEVPVFPKEEDVSDEEKIQVPGSSYVPYSAHEGDMSSQNDPESQGWGAYPLVQRVEVPGDFVASWDSNWAGAGRELDYWRHGLSVGTVLANTSRARFEISHKYDLYNNLRAALTDVESAREFFGLALGSLERTKDTVDYAQDYKELE